MRNKWITPLVIVAVIVIAIFILNKPVPNVEEELAKCIGENSVLYVQLGCHACGTQEELFGENYEHLNVVDCFFERVECSEAGIKETPTWIINGKQYTRTHSIENLKIITGC